MPPHLPSHQCHEVEVCRGKEVSRAKGILGTTLRQQCRYCSKGTCTRSPWEYWHPPECRLYTNESGCTAGDKCLFPHYKVDEQPNKRPKKGHYSHKRRESDDKNAVVIVKIVSQMGCVSQDSNALVSQRGKQSLRSLRRVRFAQSTQRQASFWEKKGPSLGKIQVKHSHQRSPPRYEI